MKHIRLLPWIGTVLLLAACGGSDGPSSSPLDDDATPVAVACADGADNDSDGKIDHPSDPGCTSATDNDETDPAPPAAACADGADNDTDGKIDHPGDPGCSSPADTDETDPSPPGPACGDGADNDGDGAADHPADPGCSSTTDDDEANPPANFNAFADYGLFLNVLTPGQDDCRNAGADCPPNFDDQLTMYENLVFTQPGQLQSVADLVPEFFKTSAFVAPTGAPPSDAPFVGNPVVITDGTRTATIKRDSFGVPHIYGATRADVMFGTGYASAEDRLFVMDVLRHTGRGRLADFVGGRPAPEDRDLAVRAGYDEQELQAQGDQLAARFGADGTQALVDIEDYIAGVNEHIAGVRNTPDQPAEYAALQVELRDFTPRDAVAIATLVQAIFAVGGGAEHRQAILLREIEHQVLATGGTRTQACQLWRDLRHADDPEKATSADDTFVTQFPPTIDENACPFDASFASAYPGAVLLDRGSYQARAALTVEECYAAANPVLGQPACPAYKEDVVDDEVETANAPLAGLSQLAALARMVDGAPPIRPPYRAPASELIPAGERDAARQRAADAVRGVQLALAGGFDFPSGMSNALLVAKSQTVTGRPIAVFGPQTGYFVPQLLVEFSQHGGDVDVRGMSFAGIPYVLIGRGVDFAWSATSSVDDIIDVRVLQLCNPSGGGAVTRESKGYVYNGGCRPMFERVDEWTGEYNPGAQPNPEPGSQPGIGKKITRRVVRAPDYGPVFATATVGSQPVALAIQRSTFFGEVDSALPFVRISRNQMFDPQSFSETLFLLTGTFNWFYVDADNIAYFNSGLLPKRATGIHPDLPSWGTGAYDWQQTGTGKLNAAWSVANFLPLSAHPRQVNPAKGYLTSWNNAQAPGFWAAEDMDAWGPVHRVDALNRRLAAFKASGEKHTPTTMVEIMEEAATEDLRGQEVLPSIFAVLDSSGPALTAGQQDAVTRLKAWVDSGSHRRDRDGPGRNTAQLSYDQRDAVILMDVWWNAMVQHVLPPIHALERTDNGNVMISGRHDAPGPGGSAFFDGYYSYVRRVVDMALGAAAHPYRQLKCAGTGVLADCRAALLASLDAALADIADEPEPGPRPEEYDAIVHTPAGASSVPDIHWVNRPTWQQVVQPTAHRHP